MFYWLMKRVLLGPLLTVIFRPRVSGMKNVPAEGPVLLACNHLSYADWLFLPLALSRRITFVGKAEYFTGPGVKGWLQRQFFSAAGQIPIDRSGASAAEGALLAAKGVLDSGGVFGIFPEGTRSPDGRLYRGKTGVARLILQTGAPVIPIGLVGTDTVAPPGRRFGRITRPTVRFGGPLDFSRFAGRDNDREALRAITDEIVHEIGRLSGQEYVDRYAVPAADRGNPGTPGAQAS